MLLCIDLFCGLGGWAEGFIAEGYDCIGFDIKRHDYGSGGYPGQLILQDVLTLHGRQFKDAAVIVASPPCQAYSYRAMPWKRAKALPAPSNELFDACFRIQREASEAAGHHIPLVVENVKGAQPWVGRAQAHYGSYYLWGDVESVGGRIIARGPVRFGMPTVTAATRRMKQNPDGTDHLPGSWFKISNSNERGVREGLKVDGVNFHQHERTSLPGGSFQSAAVEAGRKGPGGDWFENGRQGQDACVEAIKKNDGGSWFAQAHNTESGVGQNPVNSSHSNSRKAASAQISKIPFPLAQWIARVNRNLHS